MHVLDVFLAKKRRAGGSRLSGLGLLFIAMVVHRFHLPDGGSRQGRGDAPQCRRSAQGTCRKMKELSDSSELRQK
jgi:hypothetical protein